MAIIAENNVSSNYSPVEAGSYIARCYSMIHIGTGKETILGKDKILNKIRLTWELPTELKEFKEGEGEKPYTISQDFTLSMYEKANLRKTLESWRGKTFSEEEAKSFDVTKLIGVPCLISVIHTEKNNKSYAKISGISRLMKDMKCPPQINETFIMSYDMPYNVLLDKLRTLPEFLQVKIKNTPEWKSIETPNNIENNNGVEPFEDTDDLPF